MDANDVATDVAVNAWFNESPYQSTAHPVTGAPATPVVCAAAVLGPKLAAARANYAKYKSAPAPLKEQAFKECLAEGASNVLNFAARLTGYIPGDLKDPLAKEKFEAYLKKVKTAPFFTTLLSRDVEVKNKSKDYNALIDAIADTFVGMAKEDKEGVISSLGKLAKIAASTKETKQTEDIFSQSTIYVGDEIELFLYKSHVEMQSDEEKGSTTSQSLFQISTLKIRLLQGVFTRNSEKIRKEADDSVDEWGVKNTAKEGDLKTNLCLVGAK